MSRIFINDFAIGNSYKQEFILKSFSVKQTKTGQDYLDCVLSDTSGAISCKMWGLPNELDKFENGGFVFANLTVEDYLGKLQGKIIDIQHIKINDLKNIESLVPAAPISQSDMFDGIMAIVNSFESEDLKKLLSNILIEKKNDFLVSPAAQFVHHAIVGGLAYHVFRMLRVALALTDIYPMLNKDLLCSGVILHDIAKLDEYSLGPSGLVDDYSKNGKLLGHIYMGTKYVADKCNELNIPEETKILLEHMILSHHKNPEWGAVVRPMFLEAMMLHMIDNMDAYNFVFEDTVKNLKNKEFSPKVFSWDNVQIFNHCFGDEIEK